MKRRAWRLSVAVGVGLAVACGIRPTNAFADDAGAPVAPSAPAVSASALLAPVAPVPTVAPVPSVAPAPVPTVTPADAGAPGAAASSPPRPSKPTTEVPPHPSSSEAAEPLPPVQRQAFDGSVAVGGEGLRAHLPQLVWDRSYGRFGTADGVITLVGGATTLAMAIVPAFASRRRSGGGVLEEDARAALRAPSSQGRYVARDTSDVFLSLSLTYPFFIDSLISAWWFRGNADVAREMALIDAEAFAITGALQGVTNVIAARERPYGRNCGAPDLPSDSIDCTTTGRYRSFFSGHSAFSFTAAGLICSHHMRLDLLGNKVADVLSCVAAELGAVAAASLRVVGDMHYVSDVAVGALVGTTVGFVVPWMHYKGFRASAKTGPVEVTLVPTGTGASLTGAF